MFKIFKIILICTTTILFISKFGHTNEEKIKIGLLVPLTGNDKEIGQQIIKSTRIALKDINLKKIEIYPKDTNSDPNKTMKSALELKEIGVKIVIGPVFYKSIK